MCRVLRLFQFRGHTLRSKILRGKNPTEIHGALSKVCGEFTVDRCTVSLWDKHFHGSCVSIYNDPRPGRPRTSTDETSVKFVAYALEEDRRATYKELSRATGGKTSQEMHKNRPQLLVAGPLILHKNARPHIADVVTKKFRD